MTAPAGTHSFGTTFNFGGAVSYIQSIDDTGTAEVTQSKATHLLSPNARMEFKSGFVDEGEVKMKLLFDKTQFAAFRALIRSDATAFTTTFPQGSTITGSGNIKSLGNSVPDDDMIICNPTIKITGTVTFTP